MKLICVIGFMVMCASAFGGFKVPSGIFEASELEKAKVEALEKKKPLAFVYTDPGTS